MKNLLLLLTFFRFFSSAASVCYCPIVCENCYIAGDYFYEYGRAPCNDIEAQKECEKANWEVMDMVSASVALMDRLLQVSLEKDVLTVPQVGFIRSLLAKAVEDDKPEGDCANGLLTETGISGTLTHCFSPELLQQCAKVREAGDTYQDSIAPRFERLFYSTNFTHRDDGTTLLEESRALGLLTASDTTSSGNTMHERLVELIEVLRTRTRVKTARIRCASYDATTQEISAASRTYPVAKMWLYASFWLAGTGLLLP
jgi:hypothetical protein